MCAPMPRPVRSEAAGKRRTHMCASRRRSRSSTRRWRPGGRCFFHQTDPVSLDCHAEGGMSAQCSYTISANHDT